MKDDPSRFITTRRRITVLQEMDAPANIERKFDDLFRSLGFSRVSEFVGVSPAFENADYVRHSDRLVVELKVLDKDYFNQGGIIDRFCAIVPAPVNVRPDGTGVYTVTMPEPRGYLKTYLYSQEGCVRLGAWI
jgi:hypothetical protein